MIDILLKEGLFYDDDDDFSVFFTFSQLLLTCTPVAVHFNLSCGVTFFTRCVMFNIVLVINLSSNVNFTVIFFLPI